VLLRSVDNLNFSGGPGSGQDSMVQTVLVRVLNVVLLDAGKRLIVWLANMGSTQWKSW